MDQGSGRLSAENTWPPQAWVTAEFLVKQEMAWETALARSAQGSCSQDGLTAQGLSGRRRAPEAGTCLHRSRTPRGKAQSLCGGSEIPVPD